jgi:SLT domain-containing protein/surface antigen
MSGALERVTVAAENLNLGMANLDVGIARLDEGVAAGTAELAKLDAGLAGADKAMATTRTRAEETALSFKGIASGVSEFAMSLKGLVIAAGIYEVVKQTGDFQAATSLLITSANETRANIDLVRKGLLDMAGAVGMSTAELAKGMLIVERASYHGADALTVLRAAAEGAKDENAQLDVVANAVTSALQDYHLKASDAAMVTTKLVGGVSVGKTTFQEFTSALHSVLPIASAAGIGLSDVIGALASMTVHGYSAQQAAENMGHAIQHLQTFTAPQAKELALLGLSARQLSDDLGRKGLTGTLQEISAAIVQHMGPSGHVILEMQDALRKLPPEVQKLGAEAVSGTISMGDYTKAARGLSVEAAGQAAGFATLLKATHGIGQDQKTGGEIMQAYAAALKAATGDSTGLNVALMLTGENAAYTNHAVQTVSNSTTEAGGHVRGWAEIQGRFNQQLDDFRYGLEAAGISLGTRLLPVLTDLLRWFNDNKATIGYWANVALDQLGKAFGWVGGIIREVSQDVKGGAPFWTILAGALSAAGLSTDKVSAAVGFLHRAFDIIGPSVAADIQFFRDLWADGNKVYDAGIKIAQTAWPTLQQAGKNLGDSLHTVWLSFSDLSGAEAKAATDGTHLQASVNDTRDAFTRFITSDGVIGVAVYLAVTLPHHVLVASAYLRIFADVLGQVMNFAATTVKVVSDVMKGDWTGAWNDMQKGADTNASLIKKTGDDLKSALILTQEEQDGTLEKREAALRDTMLHLWDQTKAGTVDTHRQMNEEHLQLMREMHQQAVGQSIVPDMVNAILRWHEIMRTSSTKSVLDMKTDMLKGLTDLRDGATTLASQLAGNLERETTKGVNSVLHLFHTLIEDLKKLPGLGGLPNVPDKLETGGIVGAGGAGNLSFFASGGVMPIGQGMRTSGAMAIVGEGDGHEYVIPAGDPRYRQNAVNLWKQAGADLQMLASGGVVGNPYPAGQCTYYVYSRFPGMPTDGNAADWANLPLAHPSTPAAGEIVVYGRGGGYSRYGHVAVVEGGMQGGLFPVSEMNYKGLGIVDQRMSSMADVAAFLKPGVPGVGGAAGGLLGGLFDIGPLVDAAIKAAQGLIPGLPDWIRGMPPALFGQVASAVKAMLTSFTGGGPSGAIAALGGNLGAWIQQALSLTGTPASWASGLATLIGRESGGNPNAINLTDSNAAAGHPSQGLMQLIAGTFSSYHFPGTSGSITDPIANIAAGIEYIKARYGDISNVQQANPGLPPRGYDSGGWLMPGTTAWNGTGQPERVISPAQDGQLTLLLGRLDQRLGKDDDTLGRIEKVLTQSQRHLASLDGSPTLDARAADRRAA